MNLKTEILDAIGTSIGDKLNNLINPSDQEVVNLINAVKAFEAKYLTGLPPVEPPPTDPGYVIVDDGEFKYGSTAYYSVGSLKGSKFYSAKLAVAVDEELRFKFRVDNLEEFQYNYAVLAAHTDQGATAKSWTNQKIGPFGNLEADDHIYFHAPGKYYMYLGVVEKPSPDNVDVDPLYALPWSKLSAPILITVS